MAEASSDLRGKLEGTGLSPVEIDVVVLRFEYDEQLENIREELGFASVPAVNNILQQALKKLKGIWK